VVAIASCLPDAPGAQYFASVYFLASGFVLDNKGWFVRESVNQPLGNDGPYQSITFFPPAKDVSNLAIPGRNVSPDLAVPWKGTLRLGDYLHDQTGGRCFSPTSTPV
jgi:hypothetical protein